MTMKSLERISKKNESLQKEAKIKESEMERERRELTTEKEKRYWLEGRVNELQMTVKEFKMKCSEQFVKVKRVGRKRRAKEKRQNEKGDKRKN